MKSNFLIYGMNIFCLLVLTGCATHNPTIVPNAFVAGSDGHESHNLQIGDSNCLGDEKKNGYFSGKNPMGPKGLKVAKVNRGQIQDKDLSDRFFHAHGKRLEINEDVLQNETVQYWINFFGKKEKERFMRFLTNGEKYKKIVEEIFKRHGLPEDLYYLGLIESGYYLKSRSHASAVGPWQFIKGTGKRYGLRMDPFVDERQNIYKSTQAAALYLKALYRIFGDWELALPAYNAGENRIIGAIKKGGTRKLSDLIENNLIPRETRNYIPKLIAAKIVDENRKLFGIEVENDEKNFYDVDFYDLTESTSLEKLAQHAYISKDTLLSYNGDIKSEYLYATKRKPFKIFLPKDIIGKIKTINPKVLALKLPSEKKSAVKTAQSHQMRPYLVKKGDSLIKIAQKFNISLEDIRRANSLSGLKIFPNQRIRLPI